MIWKKAIALSIAALGLTVESAAVHDRASQNNHGASWTKYVRSPSSTTIKPQRIISHNTTGKVRNPNGLINGHGPTKLTRTANSDIPSIVVDFGQNVVGILGIEFAGAESGTHGSLPGLRLAFSETQEYLTNVSDFTRSDNGSGAQKLTNGTDQIAVKTSPYKWQDIHGCQHGTQVCADGLHGFRYVHIYLDALPEDSPYTTSIGSVSISSISLEWSAYLGTPDTFTGWFECSDEDLTQWWFDGVYTVDMDTWVFLGNETEPRDADSPTLDGKQVLFDGAKRDRDPYVGDLAVSSRTSYLSHDFAESSKNVLVDLAIHQRSDGWIPPASINNYTLPLFDYPLWWVVCSVDLVLYTGDTSYASTYWPNLVKTLDTYYPAHTSNTSSLLDKVASIGYGDYAFLPREGIITYYNALYVHALKYAASLADSLGHSDDAQRWTSRAANVSQDLLARNFDSKVGAFYDGGPCPNAASADSICDVHAQDGNGLAILAGITNATTSNSILNYWQKSTSHPYGNAFYDSSVLDPTQDFNDRVYAFISYFELGARFATEGQASSAFDELRRLYGWMSSHDPMITQWEGIGADGAPYEGAFTSMAHGWSTGVVSLLTNYVLGVTPLAPGFSKWQVCPVVDGGGLTWAKGVVPTPHGGIDVSWSIGKGHHGGKSFSLTISSPKGTQGSVCVPTTGFANGNVKVDGKSVAQPQLQPAGSGTVKVDLSGGKQHVITVGQ